MDPQNGKWTLEYIKIYKKKKATYKHKIYKHIMFGEKAESMTLSCACRAVARSCLRALARSYTCVRAPIRCSQLLACVPPPLLATTCERVWAMSVHNTTTMLLALEPSTSILRLRLRLRLRLILLLLLLLKCPLPSVYE